MFFKSSVVAALAGLVSAAPLAERQSTGAFGIIAIRSGSPVQNSVITASGNGFWIGKPTVSDCPASVGNACPPGNETAFTYNNVTGTVSLDVEVPGGQIVYVTPDGEFGYSIPHSAVLPDGAVTTGFVYSPAASENSVGTLTFGNGAQGFLACPTANSTSVWSVSSTATNGSVPEQCLGINLATVAYDDGYAAWEYA